jgi:hypothetical protein
MRVLIMALAACLALAAAPALARSAHAATLSKAAYTVRPTDIKSSPHTDARTLHSLPTNARVEIVGRRGGWNKIKADGTTGWVKMLSLRLAESPSGGGDNGFRTLFNVASQGGSGSTSTTGVRGLSEEKLNNPHPNPQELERMHKLEVGKAEAQRFAQAGHLKPEQMDYLPAPAK